MSEINEKSDFLNIDLELFHESVLPLIVNIFYFIYLTKQSQRQEDKLTILKGNPVVCRRNGDGKRRLVGSNRHSKVVMCRGLKLLLFM